MHNLPFSIIIPVYNDENNIPRCIKSVISQSFNNFECLLINDGSLDSTPSICDNYAKKDSRFRVFHKSNEGISKTRQFGINNSNGSYIIFIDSDDWIDSSFLEILNKKISTDSSDIIFLDFFDESSNLKEKYFNQNPSSMDSETVIKDVLECRLFSCLWNIIIKKDFYIKFNILFSEVINYGEDTLFILELLLNKPEIGYLEGAFYHHTFNRASYTRKNKKDRFYERVKFLFELKALLEKYNRADLNENNFFPYNDKFEMLSSGVFSGKEYQSLFTLSFNQYYRGNTRYLKYLLLFMAETKFYILARFTAKIIKIFK